MYLIYRFLIRFSVKSLSVQKPDVKVLLLFPYRTPQHHEMLHIKSMQGQKAKTIQ